MFKFTGNKLIPDVIVIEPQVFGDQRGFFMETYNQKEFQLNGIIHEFVQDNHSKSTKGVLRGFHLQTINTQAKLVRVTNGSVLDFAIDIRKKSQTYGKYVCEILSSANKKQLFIPTGFAHGFLTLEDNTEFLYKCDNFYSPESEVGIMYDDQEIGIDRENIKSEYGIKDFLISEKDKKNISLKDFYINNPF